MLSSFAICLIVIAGGAILGCLIWVVHLNLRARRLGLPSPTLIAYFRPPSSNPVYQSTGARQARQQQQQQKNASKGAGGGGGLLGIFGKKKKSSRGEFGLVGGDDEGAWDSRGYGGYYEEDTEMGLRVDTGNNRNKQTRGVPNGRNGRWEEAEDDSPPRGRSRSRSPRPGYNVAANRGPQNGSTTTTPKTPGSGMSGKNPFGDDHKVRRSTDTGRSSVFTEEAF
ncbi:hypothetical protein ABW20_dc0103535 [Dactylellina cionopaga]|nr:hypothetical protein ABW20_dc0103535 [Dactylellina cionopaga]